MSSDGSEIGSTAMYCLKIYHSNEILNIRCVTDPNECPLYVQIEFANGNVSSLWCCCTVRVCALAGQFHLVMFSLA